MLLIDLVIYYYYFNGMLFKKNNQPITNCTNCTNCEHNKKLPIPSISISNERKN